MQQTKWKRLCVGRVDHKTLPFRSCCYYFLFLYRDPALLPHQVPSALSYVSGILSGYINWIFTSLPPSGLIRHLPLGFSFRSRITYINDVICRYFVRRVKIYIYYSLHRPCPVAVTPFPGHFPAAPDAGIFCVPPVSGEKFRPSWVVTLGDSGSWQCRPLRPNPPPLPGGASPRLERCRSSRWAC